VSEVNASVRKLLSTIETHLDCHRMPGVLIVTRMRMYISRWLALMLMHCVRRRRVSMFGIRFHIHHNQSPVCRYTHRVQGAEHARNKGFRCQERKSINDYAPPSPS
jgi:hypothetical protein